MSGPPGVRFEIRVKPRARAERVGGTWGPADALVVEVQAAAVDGKANESVVAALATAFGLARRQVAIVSGHRSRTKLIAIDGDPDQVTARRAELAGAEAQ